MIFVVCITLFEGPFAFLLCLFLLPLDFTVASYKFLDDKQSIHLEIFSSKAVACFFAVLWVCVLVPFYYVHLFLMLRLTCKNR